MYGWVSRFNTTSITVTHRGAMNRDSQVKHAHISLLWGTFIGAIVSQDTRYLGVLLLTTIPYDL